MDKRELAARFAERAAQPATIKTLRLVNQKVHRLSANRHVGTGAESDQQIHLGSEIHVTAGFGSHCRMIHAAGYTVDFHVLIEIERIGNRSEEHTSELQS